MRCDFHSFLARFFISIWWACFLQNGLCGRPLSQKANFWSILSSIQIPGSYWFWLVEEQNEFPSLILSDSCFKKEESRCWLQNISSRCYSDSNLENAISLECKDPQIIKARHEIYSNQPNVDQIHHRMLAPYLRFFSVHDLLSGKVSGCGPSFKLWYSLGESNTRHAT